MYNGLYTLRYKANKLYGEYELQHQPPKECYRRKRCQLRLSQNTTLDGIMGDIVLSRIRRLIYCRNEPFYLFNYTALADYRLQNGTVGLDITSEMLQQYNLVSVGDGYLLRLDNV